jgi:hypothetical protein
MPSFWNDALQLAGNIVLEKNWGNIQQKIRERQQRTKEPNQPNQTSK